MLNLFLALSNKYKVTLVAIVLVLVNKFVNKEEFFSLLIKKLEVNIAQNTQLINKYKAKPYKVPSLPFESLVK